MFTTIKKTIRQSHKNYENNDRTEFDAPTIPHDSHPLMKSSKTRHESLCKRRKEHLPMKREGFANQCNSFMGKLFMKNGEPVRIKHSGRKSSRSTVSPQPYRARSMKSKSRTSLSTSRADSRSQSWIVGKFKLPKPTLAQKLRNAHLSRYRSVDENVSAAKAKKSKISIAGASETSESQTATSKKAKKSKKSKGKKSKISVASDASSVSEVIKSKKELKAEAAKKKKEEKMQKKLEKKNKKAKKRMSSVSATSDVSTMSAKEAKKYLKKQKKLQKKEERRRSRASKSSRSTRASSASSRASTTSKRGKKTKKNKKGRYFPEEMTEEEKAELFRSLAAETLNGLKNPRTLAALRTGLVSSANAVLTELRSQPVAMSVSDVEFDLQMCHDPRDPDNMTAVLKPNLNADVFSGPMSISLCGVEKPHQDPDGVRLILECHHNFKDAGEARVFEQFLEKCLTNAYQKVLEDLKSKNGIPSDATLLKHINSTQNNSSNHKTFSVEVDFDLGLTSNNNLAEFSQLLEDDGEIDEHHNNSHAVDNQRTPEQNVLGGTARYPIAHDLCLLLADGLTHALKRREHEMGLEQNKQLRELLLKSKQANDNLEEFITKQYRGNPQQYQCARHRSALK